MSFCHFLICSLLKQPSIFLSFFIFLSFSFSCSLLKHCFVFHSPSGTFLHTYWLFNILLLGINTRKHFSTFLQKWDKTVKYRALKRSLLLFQWERDPERPAGNACTYTVPEPWCSPPQCGSLGRWKHTWMWTSATSPAASERAGLTLLPNELYWSGKVIWLWLDLNTGRGQICRMKGMTQVCKCCLCCSLWGIQKHTQSKTRSSLNVIITQESLRETDQLPELKPTRKQKKWLVCFFMG